jgi:hypothetical protein
MAQQFRLLDRRYFERGIDPGLRQSILLAGIARDVLVAIAEFRNVVGELFGAEPPRDLARVPDDGIAFPDRRIDGLLVALRRLEFRLVVQLGVCASLKIPAS